MKQIDYNNSALNVRFEFPTEWDAAAITGLTLTIQDKAAVELAGAAAATLYTATSIDDSDGVPAYSREITLDSAAGNLSAGDPIQINGVAMVEQHRVKGYDSTNKIATLESFLDEDHDDNDDVYGMFANIEIDTSTVATFPKGLVMVFLWTPAGTGEPITELVQIAYTQLDLEGLELSFSRIYPRAYEALTKPVNRFADMVEEAEREVYNELLSEGLDIERLVDQSTIKPVIMSKLALMWTVNGDEDMTDERDYLSSLYSQQMGFFKKLPVWQDTNQDLKEDDGEVSDHMPEFGRGW